MLLDEGVSNINPRRSTDCGNFSSDIDAARGGGWKGGVEIVDNEDKDDDVLIDGDTDVALDVGGGGSSTMC